MTILNIIMCHLIGDYVLQCDFIVKNKTKLNKMKVVPYLLYCVPFYIVFGFTWQLPIVFIVHVVTDALKARWNKITYTQDQIIHYVIALIYLAC